MSFPWVESPLCTDLYQITMAQGYFHQGIENRHSVFNLFFRKAPFKGGYAIASGLADAIKFLSSFRVTDDDVQFLSTLRGNDNSSLFDDAFLDAIRGRTLELDIDAMPEGTVAFANEPLMRVSGPLWQAQWVETALLCIINFQTLIATKAARVCEMAGEDAVLEFGLRRAQGTNGGLTASRAAFIGGCAATSNVWAAQAFGIPCKGTHAHSWIMSFDDELTAFSAYADAMPNNCVFLVDTYNSIEGIKNAITVGLALREKGFEVVGIRLDSGDLAALSIEARNMLDEAGFPEAAIVASNDLDEHKIQELKQMGSKINVWGVGTNLVTAEDQPALGGVYKLAVIENGTGDLVDRIKLSDDPTKSSIPGIQQVRRTWVDGQWSHDVIYDPREPQTTKGEQDVDDATTVTRDLLVPFMRRGQLVGTLPTLPQVRDRAIKNRKQLPSEMRGLSCGLTGRVSLSDSLQKRRAAMVQNGKE